MASSQPVPPDLSQSQVEALRRLSTAPGPLPVSIFHAATLRVLTSRSLAAVEAEQVTATESGRAYFTERIRRRRRVAPATGAAHPADHRRHAIEEAVTLLEAALLDRPLRVGDLPATPAELCEALRSYGESLRPAE